MWKALSYALLCVMACALPVYAGGDADSTLWVTNVSDMIDSGWVVSVGSVSDYFHVAHEVVPGAGHSDDLVADLPITGVSVSVADFGSGTTYPTVGAFASNLALDSSGSTPDLAQPIVALHSPSLVPPSLFRYVTFDTPEGTIPAGATRVHTVVQIPPTGLLGVGVDSTTSHPGVATSGFTSDGYATPALMATFADLGLNAGQDNGATASCKAAERVPHGRLRVSNVRLGTGEGDHLRTRLRSGDTLAVAFFGTKPGDQLRLYFSVTPCTPAVAIGPVLTTSIDPDGDGSYLRVNATWPSGFAGQTFRFSAAWGNSACANPGAGFTNCVTVITGDSHFAGSCDDGTIESGWVVAIPSGPSDYFNNNLGDATSEHGVVGLTIAVLDFGTAVPAFPAAGVSNANQSVDPSGNTPDIVNPLALVAPFTFPALTFATTSGQYVTHAVSVPGASLGTNVHAWVQFPPGDSGLLGVGADTSNGSNGCSYFTADGYSTPAVSFFPNWGLRLATN